MTLPLKVSITTSLQYVPRHIDRQYFHFPVFGLENIEDGRLNDATIHFGIEPFIDASIAKQISCQAPFHPELVSSLPPVAALLISYNSIALTRLFCFLHFVN